MQWLGTKFTIQPLPCLWCNSFFFDTASGKSKIIINCYNQINYINHAKQFPSKLGESLETIKYTLIQGLFYAKVCPWVLLIAKIWPSLVLFACTKNYFALYTFTFTHLMGMRKHHLFLNFNSCKLFWYHPLTFSSAQKTLHPSFAML